MLGRVMCVVGALSLAACQNPSESNQARTTSGQNLGSAEWKTRHDGERRIWLPARVDIEAQVWKYRLLPERYQEFMYTDEFLILLETLYGYNGFPDRASSSEFRQMFQQYTYDNQSLPVEDWDIRYDYPVQYATFEIGDKPCVAAFRTLGARAGQYKKSAIRGYGCGDAGGDMEDYREWALAYFGDVRVND
jgi:hypothetical protein